MPGLPPAGIRTKLRDFIRQWMEEGKYFSYKGAGEFSIGRITILDWGQGYPAGDHQRKSPQSAASAFHSPNGRRSICILILRFALCIHSTGATSPIRVAAVARITRTET